MPYVVSYTMSLGHVARIAGGGLSSSRAPEVEEVLHVDLHHVVMKAIVPRPANRTLHRVAARLILGSVEDAHVDILPAQDTEVAHSDVWTAQREIERTAT